MFYRAALVDQGTMVSNKNKAAYETTLKERVKEVAFDFRTVKLLESGDIDWSQCGVFHLMPQRPSKHTGARQYETLQFHGGQAEVSTKAMTLAIDDDRACIQESWSIKRATLILNKGTDMEAKKKCVDIFKKDDAVAALLQFAIKKVDDGDASEDESDGAAATASSASKSSTPSSQKKSQVTTTLKNPPIGARKALSPAQRQALDALKTGSS